MRKLTKLLGILIALLILVGIGWELRRRSLAPENSDALIGGQLESGYSATGFLVTFLANNTVEYCGATLLDSATAITAAHCVDTPGTRFFGLGEFTTDSSRLRRVSGVSQKPGWNRQDSGEDLALITLIDTIPLTEVGKLETATPTIGCGFRVVAYGRDNPDLNTADNDRERKSAEICINNFFGNVMVMYSPRGGICLGDSGSPVYLDRTNKIVGIVSAVRKQSDNSPICFVGNTAFVTRIETGIEFVGQTVGQARLAQYVASSLPATSAPATAISQSSNSSIVSRPTSQSTSSQGINVPNPAPSFTVEDSQSQPDLVLLVLGVGILLILGTITYLVIGPRERPVI